LTLSLLVLAIALHISLYFSSLSVIQNLHLIMRAVIALFAIACVALAATDEELRITTITMIRPALGPVESLHAVPTYLEGAPLAEPLPPKKFKDIDIDQLIDIGKKVWEIIKAGKPVVDYKNDWAGAIPKGVDWMDLEGFKDMSYGPFGWEFKNAVGATNVRFRWHFAYSCKGSYDGHGAFLMNVGTAIEEIYAAWGFTVNVNATVDDKPTNYGTKIDPIAGLGVEVTIDVKTVLQSFTERCRVSIHGDCTAQILACDQ